MAKVTCEEMLATDLKAGDLWSTVGPEYWDKALDKGSIGERAYIRTHAPSSVDPEAESIKVYRLTIEREAHDD